MITTIFFLLRDGWRGEEAVPSNSSAVKERSEEEGAGDDPAYKADKGLDDGVEGVAFPVP